MRLSLIPVSACAALIALALPLSSQAASLARFVRHTVTQTASGDQLEIVDSKGNTLRLRSYGEHMIRVQAAPGGRPPFPDNRYLMIERHDLGGSFVLHTETKDTIEVGTSRVRVRISKAPLRIEFFDAATGHSLLRDKRGLQFNADSIALDFAVDKTEHFIGYGQKRLSLQDTLLVDRRTERRNYGEEGYPGRGSQGVLIVPFYISSKGYGLFANTSYTNEAHFNDKVFGYGMKFETGGESADADYVFIHGPTPAEVLNQYTLLTGRPRLPQKALFGLQLSDNEPNTGTVDHSWWEKAVSAHRAAGFPLDHLVYDNDWRAAAPGPEGRIGGWGHSQFKFEATRYPDPAAFRTWYDSQGLVLTLDLNLNNCAESAGWKPDYNILPHTKSYSQKSWPDYSNPATRRWLWDLLWTQAFDPALHYPGDALWLDESDGVGAAPETVLNNGRTWREMRNYYFFLTAYAAVAEGWDNCENGTTPGIGEAKRPHVWIRGGSAGMQRYASHWTGDIDFTEPFYRGHILGMQSSGLAGFPFFNHDAGGFGGNPKSPTPAGLLEGPNDEYYIQWGMAFGSFSPFWRPHGYGQPRWPLSRSAECQEAFRRYATLRYEMMPYIYSMAHVANERGLPMVRAMALVHPKSPEAWSPDAQFQYFWGDSIMVVPTRDISRTPARMKVWFPPAARWYDFWTGAQLQVPAKGAMSELQPVFGRLPLFVRAGAIIPRQDYALCTAWLSDARLRIDVYAGDNGTYELIEDDGVTERFRTRSEVRRTAIEYTEQETSRLVIGAARGSFKGASVAREYKITVHGLPCAPKSVSMDGRKLTAMGNSSATSDGASWSWNTHSSTLEICLPKRQVSEICELSWLPLN